MPFQVGQTILGKYRIERMLGEGGFGYVYEATDTSLQRRVAIKELKAELANNRDAFSRFDNEAKAIAQLNNPYIVLVLDRAQDGDHHYMILEFMDGGSLAGLLSKRGKFTPAEAAKITKAVCDGLAAAHRLGIIHRDIKPANILLTHDGTVVKLTDFGIAHVPAGVTGQTNMTRTGMSMGTPWYMSPEQARGERIDTRSDLYSVGVMLYEMLAGYMYLDFTSDFFGDLEKLKMAPPRPMPPGTPPGLQQIIARALAKDVSQRFQSAEEMSAALQAFITPGATIAVPRTTAPSRRVRPPTPAQPTNPLIFVGAAIGALVLIFVVLLFALRGPTSLTVAIISPTTLASATPQVAASPTTDIQTVVALSLSATQAAQSTLAVAYAQTKAALAPTATSTPTSTPLPTTTPPATSTPLPTPTPQATPTRGLFGIGLVSPDQNAQFNDGSWGPMLEWKSNPSSFTILAPNEWYRVQVYTPGTRICNFYTKDTQLGLPPSGQPGAADGGGSCDPNQWKFNIGTFSWRVSFVVKGPDPDHDTPKAPDSAGREFKWTK